MTQHTQITKRDLYTRAEGDHLPDVRATVTFDTTDPQLVAAARKCTLTTGGDDALVVIPREDLQTLRDALQTEQGVRAVSDSRHFAEVSQLRDELRKERANSQAYLSNLHEQQRQIHELEEKLERSGDPDYSRAELEERLEGQTRKAHWFKGRLEGQTQKVHELESQIKQLREELKTERKTSQARYTSLYAATQNTGTLRKEIDKHLQTISSQRVEVAYERERNSELEGRLEKQTQKTHELERQIRMYGERPVEEQIQKFKLDRAAIASTLAKIVKQLERP